jgi:hypothetical protein
MTSGSDQLANFEVCKQLATDAASTGCSMLFLPECCSFIGLNQQEVCSPGSWTCIKPWEYAWPSLQAKSHVGTCCSMTGQGVMTLQTVAAAQPLDGPAMSRFKGLAREAGIWLSLGGFQETGPDCSHIYNTHVVLNPEGTIAASYRKVPFSSGRSCVAVRRYIHVGLLDKALRTLTLEYFHVQVHLFDVDVANGPILMESRSTAPGNTVRQTHTDSNTHVQGLVNAYA